MIELKKPDIGISLVTLHRVITRGISVTMEQSRSFARAGFPDAATRAGFVSYVRSLVSLTHAHHHTEDTLVFPSFRDTLPDVPYDTLSSDHRIIEPLLSQMQRAIDTASTAERPQAALAELEQAATRLNQLWHPHIAKEEQHFTTEKMAAVIEPEEQGRLLGLFVKSTAEHSGPDYLVVPFMLYNLSREDRPHMIELMPPILTEQLVPIDWKEQWAPMKPFLLT